MPAIKDLYWETDLCFKKIKNQYQCMICEFASKAIQPTTKAFKAHFNSLHKNLSANEIEIRISDFNNKYGFVI